MVELSPLHFPFLRSRAGAYSLLALVVAVVAGICVLELAALKGAVFLLLATVVAIATLFGVVPGAIAVVGASIIFYYSFDSSLIVAAATGFLLTACAVYAAERWAIVSGRDQKIKLLFFQFLNRTLARGSSASSSRRELGRLDGYATGELYGWARDANDESHPSKVALYVEGRPQAEALAVHYRPDVGSHCFYFDLDALAIPEREACVDVRFADGRLLSNTPMKVRTRAVQAPRKEAALFMHISKTAGTAFREALAENYRQCEIAYVYPDVPGMLCRNLSDLPLEQRRGFRLIAGHFQYGIHNFFPQNFAYLTIVREPVERIISEHRYLREKTSAYAREDPAASLIAILERQEYTNLDNLLVRCFSGINESELPAGSVTNDTYLLALENLRTRFHFVGHQSRLDAAYETIRERFDWKPRGPFSQVNATRVGDPSEYGCARSAIEHYNRWDLRLYAEILRLFPLN